MNLENFNLHIAVPEDDNSSDPELIRLRAELMAIKPLLDDAIQRKSVSEAEELHKQALEAKKRLDEYKVSLEKPEEKEYKTIEINGVKVELGPELGEMTFDEIPAKLEEFNKTLKPGEKPWRVPSKKEFDVIERPIREIWGNDLQTYDKKLSENKEVVKALGFTWARDYWSSDRNPGNEIHAWYWDSQLGSVPNGNIYYTRIFVRLVR